MSDRLSPGIPKWFYVAAVLLLLWGATGIFFFYTQLHMSYDEMVAAMGKPSADCFRMMPSWQWWAYGIAVWTATLGSLALLTRRDWARPLYLLSLLAVVVQYGYSFGVLHIQDLLGWSAAIFPAVIIVIDALQLWLAQSAKVRGWLN